MNAKRLILLCAATCLAYALDIRLAFLVITSGLVALMAIPKVIETMNRLHILDHPNDRTSHEIPVPTCGGIGIFLGMLPLLAFSLFYSRSTDMLCIFLCTTALMTTGLIDDVKELSAKIKFAIQFIAASLIVGVGVQITDLHGLLGIGELPSIASQILSVILIVGVTNATNLLDGIDGLAGGIGLIISIVIGTLLYFAGDTTFAMLAFCLAGSLIGFLYYNFNPAKIFMGDTGSLIVGFLIICLGMRLSIYEFIGIHGHILGRPTLIIIGIFILPVFDTLRIFVERMLQGNSPFLPDQNHIHHLLIKTGFNHAMSSVVLYITQFILIMSSIVLSLTTISSTLVLAILLLQTLLLSEILTLVKLARLTVRARGMYRLLKIRTGTNYLLVTNIKV